jgi:hypothetical protein
MRSLLIEICRVFRDQFDVATVGADLLERGQQGKVSAVNLKNA